MMKDYEAQIYHVEEVDISGDELKDWEYQDGYMGDPEGIYIKNYTGSKKDIILPSTINGKKVRGIDLFGFGDSCQVRSIEVPGTYEIIGKDFGFNNETIEKVVIGEGITSIGENFMFSAKKLKELYVSASVTAFDYDEDSFYYSNSALQDTPWYDSQQELVIIGRILVKCKESVKELIVPEGIVTISCEVFGYSSQVKRVELANTVTRIEPRAFANSNLTVFLPSESLVEIGTEAFSNTPWLGSFKSKEIIIDHILLQGDCNSETLEIKNGIKVIAPNAFEGNNKIKKIVLPDSVTHIGNMAFSRCSNLEMIEFSKFLVSIGRGAFFECKKLTSLQLPDSLQVITRGAFSQCSELKTINIPQSLRVIGTNAFRTCSNLSVINGVSNYSIIIENNSFEDCEKLKEVGFLKTVKRLGYSVFQGCSSLKSISLSDELKAIPYYCFQNCSSLEAVKMDSFIDIMGDSCFSGCSSLKSVKVAKYTSRNVFAGCTSLETVDFSNDTISIGKGVFSGCTNLKTIQLPETLETIEAQAFYGCTRLVEVIIPDSVKCIEDEAFAECENLASITQPKSYESFGVDVFTNTKYLAQTFGEFVVINGILQKYLGKDKKVTLPDDVKIIGQNALEQSKQIETLIIPDSVKEIEDTVFGDGIFDFDEESIPSLKELVIGNGVIKIGKKAFYRCNKLEKVEFGSGIEYISDEAFADCFLPDLPDLKQLKSLKYIGKSAFSASQYGSYSYDKVELPPSVETVERSAFLGTRELVVYDTIDPNLEDADKWKYDKWNGTVNSPLSCALLSLSDGYVECQGNTNWRDYTITVKSAKDDTINFRICCDSDIDLHRDEYRSLMFSAWGKNASFKFDEYDDFFKYVNLQASKMDMAFFRLSYPYQLSDKHKKQYEAFIIRCLYIERSARNLANYIGGSDAVDKLKFLDGYGIITERNYGWIMEQLKEQDADNCVKYLKTNHSDKA